MYIYIYIKGGADRGEGKLTASEVSKSQVEPLEEDSEGDNICERYERCKIYERYM